VTGENLDPGSVLSVDQSDLSNINPEVEVSIQSHRLEEQRATEWLTFRE